MRPGKHGRFERGEYCKVYDSQISDHGGRLKFLGNENDLSIIWWVARTTLDISVLRTMGSDEARRLASKRSQLPQTKQTKRHHGRNIPLHVDRLECRRYTEVVAVESVRLSKVALRSCCIPSIMTFPSAIYTRIAIKCTSRLDT